MKDSRLIPLQHRVLDDKKLSDGAKVLFFHIIRAVYRSHELAEEEFALPWTKVSAWCHTEQKQSFARIKELSGRYLVPMGARSVPPVKYYRLLLAQAGEVSNSLKKEGIESSKKEGINSLKKGTVPYCNNPSGQKIEKRGLIQPDWKGLAAAMESAVVAELNSLPTVGRKEGNGNGA